jgi:hypothetical protein
VICLMANLEGGKGDTRDGVWGIPNS